MASGTLSSLLMLQHALLIHAPAVLFLLCPLLILLGAALPPRTGRPYRLAALMVLGAGTVALFFAIPCPGPADPELTGSPASSTFQWICRNLIVESRIIFVGLTAIYVGVILLPEILRRRENRLFSTVLPLSFLILYSAGTMFLVQTTDPAAGVSWKVGIGTSSAAAPAGNPPPAQNQGSK